MGAFIDLTGRKFGRLTVIERAGTNKHKKLIWCCLCDCGNKVNINGSQLHNGDTKSCGCLIKDFNNSKRVAYKKHKERLYRVWASMIQRCINPKVKAYKDYGGRGIAVCDEWYKYLAFREWAKNSGYNPDARFSECTIDRIDVNGNYEPSNCRWVDMKTQATNKRNNLKEAI